MLKLSSIARRGALDAPLVVTINRSSSRERTTEEFGFLAKRAATALSKKTPLSSRRRLNLCLELLHGKSANKRVTALINAMRLLSVDERHYWVGCFYTLLLSPDQRKKQSAYFTPPEIARHLLRLMEEQGVDFRKASLLDPAAGGAAFLSMVAARMKELGCSNRDILNRITGIEIDPKLAELARTLIAERLGVASVPEKTLLAGDALRTKLGRTFDVVMANPPYGRVFPSQIGAYDYAQVCHPGRINKYALFVDLSLKHVKRGGHVGLAIPSSFIAGPLYSNLRRAIRTRSVVKVLGHIECRELFVDVTQDVSLLVLEKAVSGKVAEPRSAITFGRIDKGGQWQICPSITLPSQHEAGWLLPCTHGGSQGGATLEDYGCKLSSGYFVWNRERHRMSKRRYSRDWVPLFWACNIRPDEPCRPNAKDGRGTDFVRFERDNPVIIRGPSVLIQRTTNTKQQRRIIAACVSKAPVLSRGYTSENHTIVLRPARADVDLALVCRLLNTEAVDRRYRQLSGTASISTILLRGLDLPTPQSLAKAIASGMDFEAAVEHAYVLSAAAKWRAAS